MAAEKTRKKPIRLILIASELTLSDHSVFLEHLLVGLADESIAVTLVCPPRGDVDSIVCGSVEVIRHPAVELPLMERLNRSRLVRQLQRFDPTVIHCLCESRAGLARQIARQLDRPYVLSVNSLHRHFARFSISTRRCAKIIVPAGTIASNILGAHPHFTDRVERINIGTFTADEPGCFSRPNRLAGMLTTHPPDSLSDFECLFNALRHLMIDGYEFTMVVAGSGRAETEMHRMLVALDLRRTVTIIPRLSPWRQVLTAGDVFIRPVPGRSFNPLLLEAMSVGAAVAACAGGVDDLIIEDRTAVVFDHKDELSIVEALKRLLDRHEFARGLAAGAQQHLRENYTVSGMISAVLRTYYEALRVEVSL